MVYIRKLRCVELGFGLRSMNAGPLEPKVSIDHTLARVGGELKIDFAPCELASAPTRRRMDDGLA